MNTTTNQTTFSKLRDGSWGLRGQSLVSGEKVLVSKRDGSRVCKIVGKVLWTGPDGITLATIDTESESSIKRAPKAPAAIPVDTTYSEDAGFETSIETLF